MLPSSTTDEITSGILFIGIDCLLLLGPQTHEVDAATVEQNLVRENVYDPFNI